MSKALLLPLAATLLAMCCCCSYSPFARDLTVQQPNPADVVGTYQLKAQNLSGNDPIALQNKQPEIVINGDGSCVVTDFPIWREADSGFFVDEWLSLEGTWELHVVGSVRRGGNTYQNWGIGCGNELETIGTGELAGEGTPYSILFIYDDPDSGKAMSFARIP